MPSTELVTEGIGHLHPAIPTVPQQEKSSRHALIHGRLWLALFQEWDVDAVWERKKELLKSPHFSSVFIDKDLSAESAIIRGKLRAAYGKAKDLKNITRVSIKGNKLFVNGNSYSADKLPDFLHVLPSKDNCNQHTSTSPE